MCGAACCGDASHDAPGCLTLTEVVPEELPLSVRMLSCRRSSNVGGKGALLVGPGTDRGDDGDDGGRWWRLRSGLRARASTPRGLWTTGIAS
jgi:hypothetical protein